MAISYKPGGMLRTDYETDRARLDNFPAMESDWRECLHRLMEAGRSIRYCDGGCEGLLGHLWADHVLTVLVEISLTDTSDKLFVEMQDTAMQAKRIEELQQKIQEWITRLNRYIRNCWMAGYGESLAVRTATQVKEQLEDALSDINWKERQPCFRLLRTVNDLRKNFDYHLKQVEDSGDMDGALALLLVYLRGYGGIAEKFNNKLRSLPDLYRRHILQARTEDAVQDNTYLVVTPATGTSTFTLPKGQPFAARQTATGEELIYQTSRDEYISPVQCVGMNAVYLTRENEKVTGLRKQVVGCRDVSTTETLFADEHSDTLSLGWLLESSMFVLGEGERNVRVSFRLTAGVAVPDNSSFQGFILQLSHAEGWVKPTYTCSVDTTNGTAWLRFDFCLNSEDPIPASCKEETHGRTTSQPVLRILSGNVPCPYDWASRIRFDAVEVRTEVTGIHNFTFYNELGAVDTSQPFYPFAIQSGKGAWFLFGNEEMGLKPLKEVRLIGNWKKLPETEAEFNKIYKGYATADHPICLDSFRIATEWQKSKRWNPCMNDDQPLFVPRNGENRSLSRAEVVFNFTPKEPELLAQAIRYDYNFDRDGFFRVTLQAPAIGFGADAYRTLFTEIMMHNSRCKKKECKPLPSEPILPMLADVELSYIALEETTLAQLEHSSIRLSRITVLSERDAYPVGSANDQPFLSAVPADHLLYIAFLHARGIQSVRMYFDLVLPKEKSSSYNPQPDKHVKLTWTYWNGGEWKPIAVDFPRIEETCGLTQSGFVEIRLPEKITDNDIDRQGLAWLRAAVTGDVSSCLAVRSILTNCIRLVALNGDGSPLPAGTIQGMREADERIASVVQPLPGFGGKPAGMEAGLAVRQSSRIANRHRALTARDYEQLVLEYFPEVDKVQCLTIPSSRGASEVCLIVFSRAEDNRYFLSSAWKLAEIQRLISQYAPPFAPLRVINPVYEDVHVHCKAVLWDKVQDEGKALRQLIVLAQNYLAPWYRKGEIPTSGQHFSYKELHARMVNHEDLMKLVVLKVNGKSLPVDIDTDDFVIKGSKRWHVLFPKVVIELLSPHAGINAAEIGGNFIIG